MVCVFVCLFMVCVFVCLFVVLDQEQQETVAMLVDPVTKFFEVSTN